jgi:polysaccharide biosynthesis transport protein
VGEYVHVIRARARTILVVVLLSLLAATGYAFTQEPRHAASAKVLIGIGAPPRNANQRVAPERVTETQAALATAPEVAQRALRSAGITNRTPSDLISGLTVKTDPKTDILTFRVSDREAAHAKRLATDYARQFIAYRAELDHGKYEREVGKAFLIAPAARVVKTDPTPVRDLVVGLALGLLLGVVVAFFQEGLTARVRSPDEVSELLDLPLLGRLPAPPRRLRKQDRLVVLAQPHSAQAEAFRLLRTNLDFFNLECRASAIMFTSPRPRQGKSTTVANLAVALARSGRRVILVDLDLRRPSIHRFFALHGRPGIADAALQRAGIFAPDGRPGVADAALRRVDIDAALAPVSVAQAGADRGASGSWQAQSSRQGALHVMPAGSVPPDIGEFVASEELASCLSRLRERADLVLVDGPPLLGIGDAVALSAGMDALVVVARLQEARHSGLKEVRQVLDTCPTDELGFILTGVSSEHAYPASPTAPAPVRVPDDESITDQ